MISETNDPIIRTRVVATALAMGCPAVAVAHDLPPGVVFTAPEAPELWLSSPGSSWEPRALILTARDGGTPKAEALLGRTLTLVPATVVDVASTTVLEACGFVSDGCGGWNAPSGRDSLPGVASGQ